MNKILGIDEALEKLAKVDPTKAELVKAGAISRA